MSKPLFPPKLFHSNASSNNQRRVGPNNDGPSYSKLSDFKFGDSSSSSVLSSSSEDTFIAGFNNRTPTVDRNEHAGPSLPHHHSTGPSGAAVEGLQETVRVLEGRTEQLECRAEQLEGEVEQLEDEIEQLRRKHRPPRNGNGLTELMAVFVQLIKAIYLWWISVMGSQREEARPASRGRQRSRSRNSEPRNEAW